MKPSLFKCTVDELDALANISRTTFSATFEKDNDPEDFKAYCDAAFSKEKLRKELLHAASTFYFVYLGEVLIGYFKINAYEAQSDPQEVDSLELERIYVVSDFQGQGIGYWMLQQVVALAREQQKSYLWLGVWEHNPKAIQFYERYGFTKFGEHPYFIGNDKQTDWLMRYDF